MNLVRAHRRHAVRVAAVATLVVMACYVVAALVLNVIVTDHLIDNADAQLADRVADASHQLPALPAASSALEDRDVDDGPTFLWAVAPSGTVTALTAGAPALPHAHWAADPVSLQVGGSSFRFAASRVHGTTLVAGESLADTSNVQSTLLIAELGFGAILAAAVFGGATVVGLRASAPSELVRRRQAEFTADASHELRTPIAVIEAEVELALDRPRDTATYREVLERVGHESSRLRCIVEDLLWLARADSEPAIANPVDVTDVAEVAEACVQRFGALAATHGVSLTVQRTGTGPFTVHAPPELIDRLAGVLIDNACKFAGPEGRVEVSVRGVGNRVELRVDDSGPGIPEEQRDAVFDRFHRASDSVVGTGLGLAIADSVIRSTQGSWDIGVADIGGARMAVAWRRALPGRAKAGPTSGEALTDTFA